MNVVFISVHLNALFFQRNVCVCVCAPISMQQSRVWDQ